MCVPSHTSHTAFASTWILSFAVRTQHASGSFSRRVSASLQESDYAPAVPQYRFHALYVYTLAPARYKATRDIFQVTGRPQHESQPFHLGMPLHAGALHACFAVLRFLDVNKFPMTWWRLVSQYHPFQIIRWSHHPTFPRCAAVLAP